MTSHLQSSARYAPIRPSLPKRERRTALIVGAWSSALVQLGLTVVSVLLAALLLLWLGSLGAGLVAISGNSSLDGDVMMGMLAAATRSMSGAVVAALVGFAFGALLVATGILLSGFVLRRGGIHRPWGVTWAATGVSVAGAYFAGLVLAVVFSVIELVMPRVEDPVMVAVAVLASVLEPAVYVAIGAFSWWWMAHALRRPAPRAEGRNAREQ